MKRSKGFTLIELIMVIVILGLLAAMLMPQFGNLGNRAKSAAFKGVVGHVKAGLAAYRINAEVQKLSPKWPSSLEVNTGVIFSTITPFFTVIMEPGFYVTSHWSRSARNAGKYTYWYCPDGFIPGKAFGVATYDATVGKFDAQDMP
jgi:prepilin-type N-terminal cleavage/methylation domain-containing protein